MWHGVKWRFIVCDSLSSKLKGQWRFSVTRCEMEVYCV